MTTSDSNVHLGHSIQIQEAPCSMLDALAEGLCGVKQKESREWEEIRTRQLSQSLLIHMPVRY
jgi:hypothetical protein